jgi:hypothetical protein
MELPDILSKEDKKTVNRVLGLKKINRKKDEYGGMFGMLKLTWYFDTKISKAIVVISFLALIYSIIRIIAQGFW